MSSGLSWHQVKTHCDVWHRETKVTPNLGEIFLSCLSCANFSLNTTHHQHQHGRQLGTEQGLKKEENYNNSGHIENCSYVKW